MKTCMKWSFVAALTLALVAPWSLMSAAQAEEAVATGTVTGTILDPEGKPVAKAPVKLVIPPPKKDKAAGDKGKKEDMNVQAPGAIGLDDKGGDGGGKKDKLAKPKPVAEATTDDAGKFTMNNVPAGVYAVVSMVKGVGQGKQMVTVEAGKTASVEVKMKAPKKHDDHDHDHDKDHKHDDHDDKDDAN